MTAQPDDRAPARSGGLLTTPATAGAVTWTIYLGALAATYAVAHGRGDTASQQAAVWAMSIAIACAVLALPQVRRPVRPPDGVSLLNLLLLLAGSAALLAASVTLTLHGQPVGAWVLLLPAAAGPALAVIDHRMTPAAASGTLDAGREAATETAGDDIVSEAPQPARALLRPDWQEQLQRHDLRVALEAGFWSTLRRRLRPDADEQGGVALVVRTRETTLVLGLVFPAQVRASAVRCEFSANEVDRVRRGVNAVAADLGLPPGTIRMTWVHTHPGLGVFLSGTDHATSVVWRRLDEHFTPIVVDVSRETLEEQIGVFDADGGKILPIGIVEGLVEPVVARRLATAIEQVYDAERMPLPMVLLGSRPDPTKGGPNGHSS